MADFIFQNVAYRATVYRTGTKPFNEKYISTALFEMLMNANETSAIGMLSQKWDRDLIYYSENEALKNNLSNLLM